MVAEWRNRLAAKRSLRPPVTRIERINAGSRRFGRLEHPHRRERVALFPIDLHPPGDAEGAIDRKNLARWAGDDFSLEPAVLAALTRVHLPRNVSRDAAKVADEGVRQRTVANRTAERSRNVALVSRRRLRRFHSGRLPFEHW